MIKLIYRSAHTKWQRLTCAMLGDMTHIAAAAAVAVVALFLLSLLQTAWMPLNPFELHLLLKKKKEWLAIVFRSISVWVQYYAHFRLVIHICITALRAGKGLLPLFTWAGQHKNSYFFHSGLRVVDICQVGEEDFPLKLFGIDGCSNLRNICNICTWTQCQTLLWIQFQACQTNLYFPHITTFLS